MRKVLIFLEESQEDRQTDRMNMFESTWGADLGGSRRTVRDCSFPKMDHLENSWSWSTKDVSMKETSFFTFKPIHSYLGGWDRESDLPREK